MTLLGTSPLVVRFAGTYMAHAASLACVTGAAWLLLRAEVAPGRMRLGAWAGAGAVVGVAIAIRPLTGVLMGCSLALWLMLRRRLSGRELVRGGALVALGALPALAATLLYNGVTTGDPLTFGHRAANGLLHHCHDARLSVTSAAPARGPSSGARTVAPHRRLRADTGR